MRATCARLRTRLCYFFFCIRVHNCCHDQHISLTYHVSLFHYTSVIVACTDDIALNGYTSYRSTRLLTDVTLYFKLHACFSQVHETTRGLYNIFVYMYVYKNWQILTHRSLVLLPLLNTFFIFDVSRIHIFIHGDLHPQEATCSVNFTTWPSSITRRGSQSLQKTWPYHN